jgi:hypothetical protein
MATDSNAGTAPAATKSEGKGGAFAKKIGPLPVWAWMGVGLVGAMGISALRSGKNSNSQNQQAQQQLAAAQQAALAANANQTPPYVTQNYTSSVGTATGSSTATTSSSSAMTYGWPHQGQGVQGHINAVNAWTEAGSPMPPPQPCSPGSPQSWAPQSCQPPNCGGIQQGPPPRGGGPGGPPPGGGPGAPRRPQQGAQRAPGGGTPGGPSRGRGGGQPSRGKSRGR